MANNALQPAVVDVPIGSLNTTPPDHAGPTGRLTALNDAVMTHYQDGDSKRLLIDPRPGFSSLSNQLHNYLSGTVEAGTWANPTFLFALGDQLLSICSNIPRVYNSTDWTHYKSTRIVTQRLSESVLHAANNTIAAPDHAYLAGVTCSVWTEQATDSTGILSTTKTRIGFRGDDGAWIRVPTDLHTYDATAGDYGRAQVVQDGARFWVLYNTESAGPTHNIVISIYSTGGVFQGTTTTQRFWTTAPGYWDVTNVPAGNGILLAQPLSYTATQADVHVNVKKIIWNGSSFVISNSNLSTLHCTGPVQWLTNDLTGTNQYLATIGTAEAPSVKLWAYEITSASPPASTHEYDINEFPLQFPDNMTGWAEETGVAGQRNVYVSYSQLAGPAAATGPTFDPATRFIRCVQGQFGGGTVVIRTTQSVIHQSRAFAINGEYYGYTYYQSGSGQSLPSAPISVSMTEGDQFIGSPSQPLAITGGGTYGPGIGSPPTILAQIGGSGTTAPVNIVTGDTVAQVSASGLAGIPDGTQVLKWTFTNLNSTGRVSGILKVNGSSIPTANFQWDIVASSGTTITYTPLTNRLGGTVVPGTFANPPASTVEIVGVTNYKISNLDTIMPDDVKGLFVPNGTITIAGDSIPGNNHTFTLIQRDPLMDLVARTVAPSIPVLWALTTTQVANPAPGTATIAPGLPFFWTFVGDLFTDADAQSFLTITENPVTENNADHLDVISVPGINNLEVDHTQGAAQVAQVFAVPPPLPTVSLNLKDDSTAFTLTLASVTFDYTYIGALVSIAGAHHSTVNGVFKITGLVSAHTVRCERTDGGNAQRSETFSSDLTFPVIAIQRATFVQPQTQPEWFVTPLTGSQPQVGAFEKGLAYADWRFDGTSRGSTNIDIDGQDRYRFGLSSTSFPGGVRQVVLPFRVENFTQVSVATVGATPLDIANVSEASTVGLKVFQSQGAGEGTGDAGKLMIPGLLTSEFTASGFAEHNFNIGPEAPFVVSEATDAGAFALTPGATYTYQAVFSTTLENGDVVRSLPSPPIQVTLTGTNNVVTLGGRLPVPLDAFGALISGVYGLTNHAQTTIELYRSVIVGGVPSTQLHLITRPDRPNGLYAGAGTGSGFSFPDGFTWNYRDENPDAGIKATQVVYAGTLGQGEAPHFPAPPSRHMTTWQNRRWVVGYDGAVWMSSEILEGEEPWFFPGFRYPFPPEDPAVCVVGFESNLYMLCAKSIWRIGLTQLPNNTLTAGAMPPPVKMPWEMGCSGFAVATSDMVAYSSSVNGGRQVWAITRNLANVWLSEPLGSFIAPVTAMAVDGRQRLIVAAASSSVNVWDPVAREWATWNLISTPTPICRWQSQFTYQDTGFVLQQVDNAIVDTRDGVIVQIAIDVVLSSLSFAQVRAVKRLWEAQIIGRNNGACNINAVISYPDDDSTSPTVFGPTLLNNDPVLLAINPAIEDATSFGVHIFGSYEGIGFPGKCFSLEMLSCEVGLDGRQGLRKLPDGFRLIGTTP